MKEKTGSIIKRRVKYIKGKGRKEGRMCYLVWSEMRKINMIISKERKLGEILRLGLI